MFVDGRSEQHVRVQARTGGNRSRCGNFAICIKIAIEFNLLGGFCESQCANWNGQRCQFTRLDLEVFIHTEPLNPASIDADQLVALIQFERPRTAVQPFAGKVNNEEAVTFNRHIGCTTRDTDGSRGEVLLGSAHTNPKTNLTWICTASEGTRCSSNPQCASKLTAKQHSTAFERRGVHIGNVVTNGVQALGVDGEGGKSGVQRGG